MVEVWRQMPLSGHACSCRQLALTVVLLLKGELNMRLLWVVYDLFRIVIHAAVIYLDDVSVECFTELVVFRETFVYSG